MQVLIPETSVVSAPSCGEFSKPFNGRLPTVLNPDPYWFSLFGSGSNADSKHWIFHFILTAAFQSNVPNKERLRTYYLFKVNFIHLFMHEG
jgi:hypothetical protein